jgi:Allene oxide cyclase barrel like domain
MKRVAGFAVAAAALALAIGGVSFASQSPANDSNPLVVKLLSRATAIDNFVDTGSAGPSSGDLYIWTDRELLAGSPDDQFGTVDGRCALIDPTTLKFDCSITTHVAEGQPLPAGDIMLAGTLTLTEGTTSTFAIVGGTGPYRTARGDVIVKLGPFQGPHDVTVNLILNP